jgi:hypothetical protein
MERRERMSTSDKVKAVLSCCGKKQIELAEYLGMKKQNLNTKMQRDSWPAEDLARVAEFVGAKIGFIMPDGTTIFLDPPGNNKSMEEE